jgi:hypothetical protein
MAQMSDQTAAQRLAFGVRFPGIGWLPDVSGVWLGGRVSAHAWPSGRGAAFRCRLAAVGGVAAMVAV